jgi:myo-inositol-1(or 4)-monophosphatase
LKRPHITSDLALAERAARAAGALLAERFGKEAATIEHKSSRTDPVSDADRSAEIQIIDLLMAERPNDGLIAEEGGRRDSSTGRRWIVDPLDGTTNYLYGHPEWCVSIALEDGSGELCAVVYDPHRDELFRATRSGGTQLNGRQIHVRDSPDTQTALIATGFGYKPEVRERQAQALTHILPRVRDIRRGGSAALDLAWVAAGRLDGYYERGPRPWDWAAGKLLVCEAGGTVEMLAGDPQALVAAGTQLAPKLARLVENADRTWASSSI